MSSQRLATYMCLTCPLLFCDERHKECPARLRQYKHELAWRQRNKEKVAEYNRRAYQQRKEIGK